MTTPNVAMVLAAGLGQRLRPLTDHCPKPLIAVGGRTLIDHILDRLVAAHVQRAVVNVHAFADQMEAHLRTRRDIEIVISDERAALLNTGGGIKHARSALGEGPIWIANSDYVWIEQGEGGCAAIARTWDASRMDVCLTVIPKERTSGFDTPGDFFADDAGRLIFRGEAATAPLHCFGVGILDPQLIYSHPGAVFSQLEIWKSAAQQRRLFGVSPGGFWMQVGDPQARIEAEARLGAAHVPT